MFIQNKQNAPNNIINGSYSSKEIQFSSLRYQHIGSSRNFKPGKLSNESSLNTIAKSLSILSTLVVTPTLFGLSNPLSAATTIVNCSSWDSSYATCETGAHIHDISVAQPISNTQCIRNENFGTSGSEIWVNRGCRADFEVTHNSLPIPTVEDTPQGTSNSEILCESWNGEYNACNTGVPIASIDDVDQHSNTECNTSRYGFDGSTIWVDDGCRATFTVSINDSPPDGSQSTTISQVALNNSSPAAGFKTIHCFSDNNQPKACPTPDMIPGSASFSSSPNGSCDEDGDETWAWGIIDNREPKQVWVSGSCNAIFAYQSDEVPNNVDNQPSPAPTPTVQGPAALPGYETQDRSMTHVTQPNPSPGTTQNRYGQPLDAEGFPHGSKAWNSATHNVSFEDNKVVDSSPAHAGNFNVTGNFADYETGAFRVQCGFSHMAQIDPVLAFGQERSMHLHAFFGNQQVNPWTTVHNIRSHVFDFSDVALNDLYRLGSGNIGEESLNGPRNPSVPSSTCLGGTHNMSSYWVPALVDQQGVAIAPDYANIYYKAGFNFQSKDISHEESDREVTVANELQRYNREVHNELPKIGTVSPDMMKYHEFSSVPVNKDKNLFDGKHQWTCQSKGVDRTNEATMGLLSDLPDFCNSDDHNLIMDVRFYQCWNGEESHSDSRNNQLIRTKQYPTAEASGARYTGCPANPADHSDLYNVYNKIIPAIQYRIVYTLNTHNSRVQWNTLHLSSDFQSDVANGARGRRVHGDWINGWDPKVSKRWLEDCVRGGMSCTHAFLNQVHADNAQINHLDKNNDDRQHNRWVRLGHSGDEFGSVEE